VFLLIVLIGIYYHYRLFEHFVDDAATQSQSQATKDAAAKAKEEEEVAKIAKAKVETEAELKKKESAREQEDTEIAKKQTESKQLDTKDKNPLYVNDPGLFDESTLDKRTQSYIQKQVASMVPAMMEPFEQMRTPQSSLAYSKW
jgi:hypothetical protein